MILLGILCLILAGIFLASIFWCLSEDELLGLLGCIILTIVFALYGVILIDDYVNEEILNHTVCCGKVLSIDEKFCPKCGEKNPLITLKTDSCCLNCGNKEIENDLYCSECGNRVNTVSANTINYCSDCGEKCYDNTCHNIKCN